MEPCSNVDEVVPDDQPVRSYTAKPAPPRPQAPVDVAAAPAPPEPGATAASDHVAFLRGLEEGLRLAQIQLDAASLTYTPPPPAPTTVVVTGGAPVVSPYTRWSPFLPFPYGLAVPAPCYDRFGRLRVCWRTLRSA
jgi:hypothetical protein